MQSKSLFIFVSLFIILLTVPFWLYDLDVLICKQFYYAESTHHFPLKYHPFWFAIYKIIPILTVVIAITSLGSIALSYCIDRFSFLRRPALAVFLCFLLGPGLLVNGIFKEFYGRPRPSQIDTFNGPYSYVKPLVYGGYQNAKSFPSGHASIGFACIIFAFILRRKKPKLALVALLMSLVLGLLSGIARIVGGGHFPSDVIWAAYMTFVVALALDYWLLSKGIKSSSSSTIQKRWALISSAGFGVALLLWFLFTLPFEYNKTLILDTTKPIVIKAKGVNQENFYHNERFTKIIMDVEGYGLKPSIDCHFNEKPLSNEIQLSPHCKGWFSEARIRLDIYQPEQNENITHTISVNQIANTSD